MNSFGDNICPRDGRKMTNPGNPLADNKWEITHINRIDPVLGREKSQEIPLISQITAFSGQSNPQWSLNLT